MFILDHLHCWSSAPEAAAQAYVDLFAAEWVTARQTKNGVRVVVRLGGQVIYIEQAPADGAKPGLMGLEHFALATDRFDAVVADLHKKGARFLVEPKEIRPGVRMTFVEVPTCGRVELVECSSAEARVRTVQ